MKWIKGRQETGYMKKHIVSAATPIAFDVYLLKFPTGAEIPTHTDPVETGKRHFRMNVVLLKARSGGEFIADSSILNWPRLKLFRPDITPHSVTKVESGTRYVLSIGWLRDELQKDS